jgi:hypothetical protein
MAVESTSGSQGHDGNCFNRRPKTRFEGLEGYSRYLNLGQSNVGIEPCAAMGERNVEVKADSAT